jgi:hypothetical protein
MLRWVYGTKREALSAKIRNEQKGFIITSNNFLIEKRIFEKIKFREEVKKYGHEDTLFGFDLARNKIKIIHIDNPVFHTGLESSADFLQKTTEGLESLQFISEHLLQNNFAFINRVKFLRKFKKLKRFVPLILLKILNRIFKKLLKRNLTGKNPNLFLFDVYKILIFASIKKPHPNS